MFTSTKVHFDANNKETLSRQILIFLTKEIEEKKLPGGYAFPGEIQLAEQFGVSRNILREAIKVLVSYGILYTVNGQGTYVAGMAGFHIQNMRFFQKLRDDTDVLKVLETRLILEPQIAYYATMRCTDMDIKRLNLILDQLYPGDDLKKDRGNDFSFHKEIARICKNTIIEEFLNTLLSRLAQNDYTKIGNHMDAAMINQTRLEYIKMLSAMERKDANLVREIMENHIQSRIEMIKTQYPFL